MKKQTPREQVIEYYPNAIPISKGKYFEIWCNDKYLGKGKSKKNAWKAASKNINN